MIQEPLPNTITRPYRGLSFHEVDYPLTESAIHASLEGREVYRRTEWIALYNRGQAALVGVNKLSEEPLFSPIVELRVLATPERTVFVEAPECDVGNATDLANVALAHRRDCALAFIIKGKYEHVNFIWDPQPLRLRVTEVVPPSPPKLLMMAKQVIAFDEDLPPIELVLDAVDIEEIAQANPRDAYLLPCRGSGANLPGTVAYLDTRPTYNSRWLLVGCDRSAEFHHHFFGVEAERVDICPRRRISEGTELTLSKCCLIERGIDYGDRSAVVPWGANLDEVRTAIRTICGVEYPKHSIGKGGENGDSSDRLDSLPTLVEYRGDARDTRRARKGAAMARHSGSPS